MASFNKVLLIGNLTRDPEMRYTPNQAAVATFGLACNRKFKTAAGEDREEVTFIDVTTFGTTAENANQYLAKGRQVHVEGRLKFDQWDDKNGGGKRSKLSVVAERVTFLGTRPDDAEPAQRPPANARPAPRTAGPRPAGGYGTARTAERPPPPSTGPSDYDTPPYSEDGNVAEDDIPF